MKDRRFVLSFHGSVEMSAEEVWPDGDGPEDPGVADVEARLEECGPIDRLLGDWNLADDLDVIVTPRRRSPWDPRSER